MSQSESGDEALIAAAAAVRARAYAPYSGFAVGAAIRAEDDRLYVGANVENAAYPEGICAEAAAVAAMVAGGARRIEAMAVVASGTAPVPPCGGCRQRIAEFAVPATPVHLVTVEGGHRLVTIGELLPFAFGAAHLAPEHPRG